MKVAVVGAGLFGCTIASFAARTGHDVVLFDKATEIMGGATRANQLRLHRGYHYPRASDTVAECRDGMDAFMAEYGEAVVPWGNQYYAIAKGSKTTPDEYVCFLDAHFLEWHPADLGSDLFNERLIDAAFQVPESRIDYHKLRSIVSKRLDEYGVQVALEQSADIAMRDQFDQIVIAGYAGTNEIADALGCGPIELQYEHIEKPIVRLPAKYHDIGCVVMDGPFGCVDPAHDGYHLVGHVEHAVRDRWTGTRGRNQIGMMSAFNAFKADLTRYLPFMEHAVYHDSMWTTRVVLPRKDATDERPTLTTRLDGQVMRVLAGKLGHAVTAAHDTLYTLYAARAA